MTTKIIPHRYFNELKNEGHTVPRNDTTGEVLDFFKVGKDYNIMDADTKETVSARCTQNCPHHLKLNTHVPNWENELI